MESLYSTKNKNLSAWFITAIYDLSIKIKSLFKLSFVRTSIRKPLIPLFLVKKEKLILYSNLYILIYILNYFLNFSHQKKITLIKESINF